MSESNSVNRSGGLPRVVSDDARSNAPQPSPDGRLLHAEHGQPPIVTSADVETTTQRRSAANDLRESLMHVNFNSGSGDTQHGPVSRLSLGHFSNASFYQADWANEPFLEEERKESDVQPRAAVTNACAVPTAQWDDIRALAPKKDALNADQLALYDAFLPSDGMSVTPIKWSKETLDAIAKQWRRVPTDAELHALVGAPLTGVVEVFSFIDTVTIHSQSSTFLSQWVTIHRENNTLHLHLEVTHKAEDVALRNVGSMALALQYNACKIFGISKIATTAARGPTYNGYYTWARNGGNADLTRETSPRSLVAAMDDLTDSPAPAYQPLIDAWAADTLTVRQLMQSPEGRDLWRNHGDTIDLTWALDDPTTMDGMDYVRQKVPIRLIGENPADDPHAT